MQKITRVIIESPYAGDIEANLKYAKLCILDSLRRGEAPLASHLLYTQPGILDDSITDERELGIAAWLAWQPVAEKHVFYIDRGWSRGMLAAFEFARRGTVPIEIRSIEKKEPLLCL